MTQQLKPEDFGDWDWDDVLGAGYAVMSVVGDLAFHNMADQSWEPWTEYGDTPALIGEVRAHLDRLDEAVKDARRKIATVERPARLRAVRRERNSEK
jgi:hypothetical protein